MACVSCDVVLQAEVEKLSLEEQRLDDQIRLYNYFVLEKEKICYLKNVVKC